MEFDKTQLRIERGVAARQLLDFAPLWAELETDYFNMWRHADDPRVRGRLWAQLRALDDIRMRLGSWKSDGERAQKSLTEA